MNVYLMWHRCQCFPAAQLQAAVEAWCWCWSQSGQNTHSKPHWTDAGDHKAAFKKSSTSSFKCHDAGTTYHISTHNTDSKAKLRGLTQSVYGFSFFLFFWLQFMRKRFHDKTQKITLQMFQTYLCCDIVCHYTTSDSLWCCDSNNTATLKRKRPWIQAGEWACVR